MTRFPLRTVHGAQVDLNLASRNAGIRRESMRQCLQSAEFARDIGAWAVTCFKVRPDRRGRRIAHQLLLGVLEDLPKRGATRVEAFPKRLKTRDPMDHWTGPESIYLACGFEVVRDHKRHPVLALDLR